MVTMESGLWAKKSLRSLFRHGGRTAPVMDSSGVSYLQSRSCEETSECVMVCTESAMRFCTPTFPISLAT